MSNTDSHQHVVKTSAQWNERAIEYWIVPRGCLCVELTPKGKTKLKVGEGNKNYYQLPYIYDFDVLLNYYTKEQVDALFNNYNRMAIMSTNEYNSATDLPRYGNKFGDVRFVKSKSPSIKTDPDLYVWNGHKWIFIGTPFNEITDYVNREEFNQLKARVEVVERKAHTHDNKEILDSITQADREKFDSLHNYDDTEIRELIAETGHTHPNKPVLDQITQADLDKLDSLHNYDDTELRRKISNQKTQIDELEAVKHSHDNKSTLDRITDEMLDELDTFAQCCFEVKQDIAELKENEHSHHNLDLLNETTASYTLEDQKILYDLYHIGAFLGAGPTWDGTMGYVPMPEAGCQNYFLRGDGTWALVKATGDKYKAGEGIYILSGEVTADSFPFKLYAKGGYVKQYIIYGAPGGVGDYNSNTGKYHIPIRVSAEGHTPIETVIQIDQKLYENDWINFELQEYSVYRTNLTNDFRNLGNQQCFLAINQDGSIEPMPGSWGYQDGVSDYYEMDPDAIYELPIDIRGISWRSNVNIYDANKNRTRTVLRSNTSVVNIIPQAGEKYLRIAAEVGAWEGSRYNEQLYKDPVLFRLKDTVFPVTVPLQQIQLIPNSINTIDVLTTVKPLDMYVETFVPPDPDPDDPMSEYTGIIYNDGVLDVTQEDPTALNELTFHYRDNVYKVLTIPTYNLEPATTTTLGGVIVGDGLSVDQYGEISVDEMTGADGTNAGTAGIVPAPSATDNTKFLRGDGTWVDVSGGGGSEYVEGNGIEFIPSSITPTGYQTVEYIQSTGTQAIILGYTPSSQNVKIELKFSDINNSASGWHYMYGGWDTDSIRPPSVAYQQNGSNLVVAIGDGLSIQNGEYPSTSGVHTSTLTTLNGNYVSLQLDSGTIRSSSFSGSIYRPMALFAQTNSAATTVAEFGSYKFHEMKIFEDDVLIHHYYPCYRLSDDEIGIYDIIDNVFLTNSGTGTFIRSNTPVYIDGPDSINAKLGVGLRFDVNDAIELDDSITIRFNCNNDPNEY